MCHCVMLVQLSISGMSCGSCSVAIQSALDRLPGITNASVGLLSNSAQVMHLQEPHQWKSIDFPLKGACSKVRQFETLAYVAGDFQITGDSATCYPRSHSRAWVWSCSQWSAPCQQGTACRKDTGNAYRQRLSLLLS